MPDESTDGKAGCGPLRAPFQYFGGKSAVASLVWSRFGDVRNLVEPFFGSGAVLLGRPRPFVGTETVNDKCGFISNFWRAVKADPDAVAFHADWPVCECDLHARHSWLVGQTDSIVSRLEGDPEWYDAKVAGWWCWGMACWIGSGFCSGRGPWQVIDASDGSRKLVHLGDAGRGVNRQLVHLGNAGMGEGEGRQPETGLGECGITEWMRALSERLARVRVCTGDWSRVCGDTPTIKMGLTACFLDPPYADTAKRTADLYSHDDLSVAHDVRRWAIERGDDPKMRICLAGYADEHEMPDSWECVAWKAKGGYASQSAQHDNPNAKRERIWFSPHCLKPAVVAVEPSLFATSVP